jgi:glutathione S-transferase
MKLYVTMTSPYGRLARIVVLEKKLEGQVEIVEAQTRTRGSPFYQINPSGRVPCLVRDDGVIMEDSQLICAWLDSHDGNPRLTRVLKRQDWVYGRLESYARSMLDGVAVWVREMRRPERERSPTTLQHEVDRCVRMADFWEREIGDALMRGPLNMAQMLLISAIELAEHRKMAEVLPSRAKLAVWARRVRDIPSIKATRLQS